MNDAGLARVVGKGRTNKRNMECDTMEGSGGPGDPISRIGAEIGRVPILPTGVIVDATFLNKTATGILLAGRTYTFSVNLSNEPGTTTSWFSAEAGVKIIKLC